MTKRRGKGFPTAAFVVLLLAAGTYFLPLIRIQAPPAGEKRWSAWEMTRRLPAHFPKPASRSRGRNPVKVDVDLMDLLGKISRHGESRSVRTSLSVILGGLAAIALAFAYLLVFFALLTVSAAPAAAASAAGFAVMLSGYALGGLLYLSRVVEDRLRDAAGGSAPGIFGFLSRRLTEDLSLIPDVALYALPGLAAAAFLLLRRAH